MSMGIFVITAFLLCIFVLFAGVRTKNSANDSENDNSKNSFENNKYNEVEEKFFDEVSNGKIKYKFLKIDNQFDLMFIKSIFYSENIPYYVEFEHISGVRPGMYIGDLGNYNLLYILNEDYDDAIKVVENYLSAKKNNNEENMRNTIEILLTNWKVPSAGDKNGIEIIYKEDKKPVKNIVDENDDELNLLEINNTVEENNEDGNDFRHDDIWVCGNCGRINEMYIIECKNCGKAID